MKNSKINGGTKNETKKQVSQNYLSIVVYQGQEGSPNPKKSSGPKTTSVDLSMGAANLMDEER